MTLQLEDGSIASPSLRWNSQTNTGFYTKASGHFGYPATVYTSHFSGSDFEVISLETAGVWVADRLNSNTMTIRNDGAVGSTMALNVGSGNLTGLITQGTLGLGTIELVACSNGFRVAKFVNRASGDVGQALFGLSSGLTNPSVSFMDDPTSGMTRASGDGAGRIRFITGSTQHIICVDGSPKTMTVTGNHTITGTKSAAVETETYGWRSLYTLESTVVKFSDMGTATLSSGVLTITLDPIFLETVEGILDVYLTPYGNAQLYVYERGTDHFTVKSVDGSDISFGWMVYADRKDYAGIRLEEFTMVS